MRIPPSPLNVTIRARDGIKYQGQATTLTSFNAKGTFDVLSEHANFICTISHKLSLQMPDGQLQDFNVDNGVLHVSADTVTVYLDIK